MYLGSGFFFWGGHRARNQKKGTGSPIKPEPSFACVLNLQNGVYYGLGFGGLGFRGYLGLTSFKMQARMLSKACAVFFDPPKLRPQSLKAIIMTQASSLKVLVR